VIVFGTLVCYSGLRSKMKKIIYKMGLRRKSGNLDECEIEGKSMQFLCFPVDQCSVVNHNQSAFFQRRDARAPCVVII
jgi:hypothetical protein